MNWLNEFNFKEIALNKAKRTCYIIGENYEKLYDENNNRDRLFMKELVDTILQVEILTSVYLRDGQIHPSYCLEKLNIMICQVETQIGYWEAREKQLKGE